jgi:hypothetical protein
MLIPWETSEKSSGLRIPRPSTAGAYRGLKCWRIEISARVGLKRESIVGSPISEQY